MNTDKKTYYIISGEGECGTWSRKVATERGIKRILARGRRTIPRPLKCVNPTLPPQARLV